MQEDQLRSLRLDMSHVLQGLEAAVERCGEEAAEGAGEGEEGEGGREKLTAASVERVFRSVEQLVSRSLESGDSDSSGGGSAAKAAQLAHGVAAYCASLGRGARARIACELAADATHWLTLLYRLPDYSMHCHHEPLEGLARVTRLLLHLHYPRYVEEGALALTEQPPCVYSSVASPLGVVQHVCRQLALPLSCIRPVPAAPRPSHPHGQGMDPLALERAMSEDEAAGRRPLLVVGETDAGDRLAELARAAAARGAHLHLRGHSLAALALALAPASERSDGTDALLADSVTLALGSWLGAPSLPAVTLYRCRPAEHTPSGRSPAEALCGLGGGADSLRSLLPLWVALRVVGPDGVRQLTVASLSRAAHLYRDLAAVPDVRLLSKPPPPPTSPAGAARAQTSAAVVEGAVPYVLLQFYPEPIADRPPPYYDKLNSWLGQILQRENEQERVEAVETEAWGVAVRYCPLEGGGGEGGDPAALAESVRAQLGILRATLALRDSFAAAVTASALLRLVHVESWAGLGGVRYVPEDWQGTDEELDSLNMELVEALQATDAAFSCGKGDDGLVCVRFGMVTEETDVDELLELVRAAGRSLEERGRRLASMTQIVKRGIETATEALQREAEEALWQEGLLRRVPVVGRVVGWLAGAGGGAAPPPGRSLHLARGTVQTTEDIYKYHRQTSTPPPSPAPPPS